MQSTAGLPYGLSWYLDAVAENWDGLVWGNYEAVMPLTWLRKFGIKCLYQPYYCQQAGVFSPGTITTEIASAFLSYCRENFRYVNLNLNQAMPAVTGFKLSPKKNLLLPLQAPYASIRKKYTENHRRNIAKAQKKGLAFDPNGKPADFIKFYLGNINRAKENFKPQHERILKKLIGELTTRKAATINHVHDAQGNRLAASLIINHSNRLINIINTSSAVGKANGASHFLFNSVIERNSGKPLLLDFEGSSIPSIARFYEGFGAQPEFFHNLSYNTAERLIQLFK